jgi:outer membrane immunogenic protein
MKKLLLSTAAVALMSTAALAADLPIYEPAPMVAPVPEASDWSGVYIGVHGGYGWGNADGLGEDDFDLDGDDDVFGDAELEGGVIGGQIGYNLQFNQFVIGIEGDGSYSFIDDDEDSFDDDDDDGDIEGMESEIEYLATIRGRAGFALDRFMLYGTGGVAFAGFNNEFTDNEEDPDEEDGLFDDDGDSETEVGYVYGGGAEVLLTNNVTAGVEYLHYEFEEIGDDDSEIDGDVDVIRGRVNVKFNSLFGG